MKPFQMEENAWFMEVQEYQEVLPWLWLTLCRNMDCLQGDFFIRQICNSTLADNKEEH